MVSGSDNSLDDPFFGTDEVRALQRAQDQRVQELTKRPGAVIHARTFSADDPAQLG